MRWRHPGQEPCPVVLADDPPPYCFLGKKASCWAEGVHCQIIGEKGQRGMKRILATGGRSYLIDPATFPVMVIERAGLF